VDSSLQILRESKNKREAIPVTAVVAHRVVRRGGSHIYLGNRLTIGGEVLSLTRRLAALYPQEGSWY
jgi:hypothetical protein